MRSYTKMRKRMIALGLALGLTVTSAPLYQAPMTALAAGEELLYTAPRAASVTLASVREEAKKVFTESKKGFDLDMSKETFAGAGVDYSGNQEYMEVLNNLRTGSDDQTLIIRFKTTQSGTTLLFGAGKGNTTDGSDMIVGLQNGKIRIAPRNDVDGGLLGSFESTLNDGNYHTLALSFLPSKKNTENNLRMVVDGSVDLYGTNQYAKTWYQRFVPGFNQKADIAYSTLKIGGTGFQTTKETLEGFQGSVDFVTLINKAYTVEELRQITVGDKSLSDDFSVMKAAGSRNTSLFTGGTEMTAAFQSEGMTRNFVGMFEDKLREGGSYVERGRFVFNLAKKGADVASILADYDTMISPYGTKAVGIMVGASDYTKGEAGLAAFKESLGSLLSRIYSEDKLPFVITPYPAADGSAQVQIAAYTEAVREVAAGRTKVVDLSVLDTSLVQEDGSLTARGHQQAANRIKAVLGVGTATNFSYHLEGGSYTVAKKAADGSEAQVKEVTAGKDSVAVSVDEASVSGDAPRLSYLLQDTRGQEVSGTAPAGSTAFTVRGLKEGEAYTLTVFDESRQKVKETYRPVSITVLEGEKGVSLEYPDGNTSVNEEIQSLLTREEPATYLFMGDSITHGVLTDGYDNVPMLFKKYLNELDRTEDVVLNTGVTNATIATTLDQIDERLEKFTPDVVLVMLGTNDCATNGENTANQGSSSRGPITVEQYKERYKQLVRKIHENNEESSVVLRVPCAMSDSIFPGQNRSNYEEYFKAIPAVAQEMKAEIPDLNIAVVDHLAYWRDYRDNVRNDNITANAAGNYGGSGWLVPDGIHPNGRGQTAMFQQIVRELGLYQPTSEMANYQYALSDWTDSSQVAAPVIQKESRAYFDMGALKSYENKVKNVTVTLTGEDGSISRTADYAEDGTVILDGLDRYEDYTVSVTGKDAQNSKEITFASSLTAASDNTAAAEEKQEVTDSLEAARGIDLSGYPADVKKKYEQELRKIQMLYVKDTMTAAEVDEALALIRMARANLAKQAAASEQERKDAKAALARALAATETRHAAGRADWTEESWKAYDAAYRAAGAADDRTETEELKRLLAALKAAEAGLTVKTGETIPPEPEAPALVEGKVYEAGNYRYKVLSNSGLTVEAAGFKPGASGTKINIGSTVKLGGKSYRIVSVGPSAFKGNKKAVSAVIGKNVQTIGKNAFAGCAKLKKVTVKSVGLKKIDSRAFLNCKALRSISLKSKGLKKVGKQAFKGIYKKAVIKVPSAKLKAYQKLLAKKGQSRTVRITK